MKCYLQTPVILIVNPAAKNPLYKPCLAAITFDWRNDSFKKLLKYFSDMFLPRKHFKPQYIHMNRCYTCNQYFNY